MLFPLVFPYHMCLYFGFSLSYSLYWLLYSLVIRGNNLTSEAVISESYFLLCNTYDCENTVLLCVKKGILQIDLSLLCLI